MTYHQVTSIPDNARAAQGRHAEAPASSAAVHAGFKMSLYRFHTLKAFCQTGQASMHSAAPLRQMREEGAEHCAPTCWF